MSSLVTSTFNTAPCSSPPMIPFKSRKPSLSFQFARQIPSSQERAKLKTVIEASSISESSSPRLNSAQHFELSVKNVDLVLEDVRPYLIADGGNVDVVSVEGGVVSLHLQGACGSCPSSTTTMKMGIERALKEKFGEAVKGVRQVYDEQVTEISVQAVNRHLDILRPAIKNFGGSVEVIAVGSGDWPDCTVKYEGPESIGSGIKAAIKEKFPGIVNVILSS